jgi:Rad3-related DNA helicase
VSTRFRDRAESVAPIVALMGRQHAAWRGNYLAFFSSFDYLKQVATRFQVEWPQVPVWLQSRQMDEPARRAFLDRFTADGHGIGFAVLGGSFGEGIDLPGTRLIGAFIATLGLPQVNPVNEQMKQRLETVFGAGQGHDYAYLFPGLQKVVQAAGRVIRGPGDRGVVYLIDDRYAQARVRRLLPRWWAVAASGDAYSGPGSSLKPASATPMTALTTTLSADGT